ncbi:unnamed protein product [Arctia plantaginis]|uniref:Gustatory receptor n=1 Tax=Arctia plantaginis TaxID=874455 RepID=A0A8S0Z0E9_ARCPL|nr:unnamed protein product [Arctia plantaginis]
MVDATDLETECVVSGTLYFVLLISRLAGTSPVKFERVNGGWRICVSLIYYIYCCVVQIVLAVGIGIFVMDRDNIVDGYEASHNTGFMRIILIIYFVVHVMSGAAIAFTGLDRMRHMIDCKARLQWNSSSVPQSFEFAHVNEETKSNEGNPIPNHVISCAIDSLPVNVKRRTNNGLKTDPATLERLIEAYCSMCGIIRQLNDSNGFALLLMLLFIFIELLTAPYFAVAIILRMHSAAPVAKILSWLMWCLLCIVTLAITVDACHRSHIQLWMTRRLIRQMRRHTHREAAQVSDQLKMFYRHIQLNPVRFAPLKLMLFNRNILIMVWTGVITYLSVVIHL